MTETKQNQSPLQKLQRTWLYLVIAIVAIPCITLTWLVSEEIRVKPLKERNERLNKENQEYKKQKSEKPDNTEKLATQNEVSAKEKKNSNTHALYFQDVESKLSVSEKKELRTILFKLEELVMEAKSSEVTFNKWKIKSTEKLKELDLLLQSSYYQNFEQYIVTEKGNQEFEDKKSFENAIEYLNPKIDELKHKYLIEQ